MEYKDLTKKHSTNRDLRKEFQVNPLTALLPNEGSIDIIAKYLEKFSTLHDNLNTLTKDNKISEEEKKKIILETEMLSCILSWAGLIPKSSNFLSREIENE